MMESGNLTRLSLASLAWKLDIDKNTQTSIYAYPYRMFAHLLYLKYIFIYIYLGRLVTFKATKIIVFVTFG